METKKWRAFEIFCMIRLYQGFHLLFGLLTRSIKYSSQVPTKLFNSLAGVVPRLEFHHARLTDQQVSTSKFNSSMEYNRILNGNLSKTT